MFHARRSPYGLWFVSVLSIAAIVTVGVIVARATGHTGSPIALRLAAAGIVTALVAVAKLARGPRAAALTGVMGTLISVALLIHMS